MTNFATKFLQYPVALIAAAWLGAGCVAGSSTRTVYEADEPMASPLQSVLVIGVAGDLNGRAKFERKLSRDLELAGIRAVAYHSLGRSATLSRDGITAAVEELGVDGVVVTREIGRDAKVDVAAGESSVKESTRGGGLLNMFRYDYETLNEPTTLALDIDISLATDVYSTEDRSLIWTGETNFVGADNVELLIDTAAGDIAAELIGSGIVGDSR